MICFSWLANSEWLMQSELLNEWSFPFYSLSASSFYKDPRSQMRFIVFPWKPSAKPSFPVFQTSLEILKCTLAMESRQFVLKKFQIRIQQNPNNPNLTSNFNEMFPITRILVLVTPIKCHSISFSCFIIGKTTKTNTTTIWFWLA